MSRTKSTDYVGSLWEEFRGNRSVDRTQLIERFYLRWITELAVNRFVWTGLPEEPEGDIRPRYMELTMFRKAFVVFFKHSFYDKFLALQATAPGNLDMYFDPTQFHIYGNGTTPKIDGWSVSAKESVPIWSNRLRCPDLDLVEIYVSRLARFDRTIDTNVQALAHPFILVASQENRHTVEEAYRQVQDGQPVMIFSKDFMGNTDDIKKIFGILDMKIDPDSVSNLLVDKKKVWNELLTFLGINNANQDKRERLVADEVQANNSEVGAARAIALGERQAACEKINKMFGLNIWCEWNPMVDTMNQMPDVPEGVEDNGDVHDDNQESR